MIDDIREDGLKPYVKILRPDGDQLWLDDPIAALTYAAAEWASRTQCIITSFDTRSTDGQIEMCRSFGKEAKLLHNAIGATISVRDYVVHTAEIIINECDVADVLRLVMWSGDGVMYSTVDQKIAQEITYMLRSYSFDLHTKPMRVKVGMDSNEPYRLIVSF